LKLANIAFTYFPNAMQVAISVGEEQFYIYFKNHVSSNFAKQ